MNKIKEFLEEKVALYNDPSFIKDDPISIPAKYSRMQDMEIMGFFAAILAWGRRKTIIDKCRLLEELMDHSPYEFVTRHSEADLDAFRAFKHRTFNFDDLLFFINFFKNFYRDHNSLEEAFLGSMNSGDVNTGKGLAGFKPFIFNYPGIPHLKRTEKHIASPLKNSTCKRLNMFLRWMVRKDDNGVDFGIWENISPSQLICPVDVHVARVARKLGLIDRKQTDWKAVLELDKRLRKFDPQDPSKYDFALFGLGIIEDY